MPEEARAWATAAALARAFRDGRYDATVTSRSMVPLLRPGDVVFLTAGGRRRWGDVVLAVVGGRAVTHRLVGRRAGAWLLKGDRGDRLEGPVPAALVVGRAVAVVKANGRRVALTGLRARAAAAVLAAASRAEALVAAASGGTAPPWARALSYAAMRAACAAMGT
jgi:hypothetical protein